MSNKYLILLAAWLIPGAGHLFLHKWGRGAILLAASVILLIVGLYLGGLYYPGGAQDFFVMYWLQRAAAVGNGVFLMLNLLGGDGGDAKVVSAAFQSPFFEYGGRFIALAGLLNFLAMFDVWDIFHRRKI